jgi:hypothetical protein
MPLSPISTSTRLSAIRTPNSLPTKSNSQSRGKKHQKISDRQNKSPKTRGTITSIPPTMTETAQTSTKSNCLPVRESSRSSPLPLAPSDSNGTVRNQDQTKTSEAHKRVSSGLKSNPASRFKSAALTKAFTSVPSTNWTSLKRLLPGCGDCMKH